MSDALPYRIACSLRGNSILQKLHCCARQEERASCQCVRTTFQASDSWSSPTHSSGDWHQRSTSESQQQLWNCPWEMPFLACNQVHTREGAWIRANAVPYDSSMLIWRDSILLLYQNYVSSVCVLINCHQLSITITPLLFLYHKCRTQDSNMYTTWAPPGSVSHHIEYKWDSLMFAPQCWAFH